MGTFRTTCVAILLGSVPYASVQAWSPDLTLYNQAGNVVRGTLAIDLAYFSQDSSWYGESRKNLGDYSSDWWEAAMIPGLEGELELGRWGGLYGRVSAAVGYTFSGVDAAGSNAGLGDVDAWDLEDAYVGWRSGKLFDSLGDNALDLSVGRRNYQAGSGFLFQTNASNGGKRGGFWVAPRKAADFAAIAHLQSGDFGADLIYLNPNDQPDSDTSITGVTLDYALGDLGGIGGGYYRILDSQHYSRDGMNVFDLRFDLHPLSSAPQFGIRAEYVYEHNTDIQAASGGYARAEYKFEGISWEPVLSYRYAYFEGDDPATRRDENFDPLYYGFNDWNSWYIGEILGEYLLLNQNLIAHTVQLQVEPTSDLKMSLFYFQFQIDDPQGFDSSVTARDFAKEIDLVADWSATDHLSFSAVAAVSMPDAGATQYTGGDDDWWYFMLLASVRF